MNQKVYTTSIKRQIKIRRTIWNIVYAVFFHTLPTSFFWPWRRMLLRLFGAEIAGSANVYSSVKIWAPWNLKMAKNSCLGPNVICYNQALVELKEGVVVSQYTYLCTAGHDISLHNSAEKGLVVAPITVNQNAWVGAKAYIGMGVEIGEYAVIGATASVYKDVEPWTVVGGNPAKVIKRRIINEEGT